MKDELKISYSVCSEAGRIAGENEDNFYVNGRILRPGVPCCRLTENTESGDALFAVFDGLGGEEHGELASAMAAENLGRYHGTFGSFYDQYLTETNKMIAEKLQKGKANTGTTVAAVAIRGREAVIVNLGDSRVYLIENNTIKQLSTDHSEFATMLRYGVVQKEEYYTSPLRSHLTRYLGMHSGELLEPGVVRTFFSPGSMFLLCSDGVCGSLRDEEMLASIREERTAEHLVRKALTAGSRDNVTAILVWTD